MSQRFDLTLIGAECLTPSGRVKTDIGVLDGRIRAFGDLAKADSAVRYDAKGLTVLPGVIDSQVHLREPGSQEKEGLERGTAAAAKGGVTAVFEMPNTDPPTLDDERLRDKWQRAKDRVWTDIGFYVGTSLENIDDLARMECLEGVPGLKLFMGSSTKTLTIDQEDLLMRVLKAGRRRIAVHSEDQSRIQERRPIADNAGGDVRLHSEWRDAKTAWRSTERLLPRARAVGRPVHVLHVTTRQEVELLQSYRDIATMEVTPLHLALTAPEAYERLGARAQMNPPIRTKEHNDALWRAVREGLVDCLGSDHAPHIAEDKAKTYPFTPAGLPGVQTLVPQMLGAVAEGKLTLERFVDLTSTGPARIFGIRNKGRIALGYDADFTVVDLKRRETIRNDWIESVGGWTPLDGIQVTGWPVSTIIRGRIVMRDAELLGPPMGRAVRFLDGLGNPGSDKLLRETGMA
ncbi:MAG: dihydroorotase [Magnetovibrionaceae bacterium]